MSRCAGNRENENMSAETESRSVKKNNHKKHAVQHEILFMVISSETCLHVRQH